LYAMEFSSIATVFRVNKVRAQLSQEGSAVQS
jgi:hypothetical protein